MSRNLQLLQTAVPVGSLEDYIQKVNKFPMLSKEEEVSLAQEYQENNDLEAARRLVMAHLRFVVKVAKGYSGYGLAISDLIQEGNIGLMKAVKRFDPSVGVRLVSFAVHWVKSEIHEFIIRNWRIVKIATTKAQRKLFFNLRSSKKRLGWFSPQEVQDVASALDVSEKEVLRMEERLNAHDAAFDLAPDSGDDDYYVPAYYLEDKSMDPAHLLEASDTSSQGKANLTQSFEVLDERSKDILSARWLSEKKTTLQSLADKYGVSPERIRQLEKNAMNKLKDAMEA